MVGCFLWLMDIKIAIDRGGTFTDVYVRFGEQAYTKKLLSVNPQSYENSSVEGIKLALENIFTISIKDKIPINKIEWVRMGTTLGTNALLERKGSKTALLVTKGFKDILTISYQNRPKLFDLNIKKPTPLYSNVLEVEERVVLNQNKELVVETEPNLELLKKELIVLQDTGIESIAISFMHAYSFFRHEQLVSQLAKEVGFGFVVSSHEVLPTMKYIDRCSTTVLDAYLTPHIQKYLDTFYSGFRNSEHNKVFYFMQSNGGLVRASNFRGSNSLLSGPAGGIVGLSSIYNGKPLIGFDMGGTSTDVCRFAGEYELSDEYLIDGVINKVPQLDIVTVAAGGGSRLFYKNGMFVVGPESSSSHPGPICYRKNGYLSLTDANLILNRILPKYFPKIFGKEQNEGLDVESVQTAMEDIAKDINRHLEHKTLSIEEIALGFIQVANFNMIKPIKTISIERGFDIQAHTLVCYGSASAQHACAIAKNLEIKEIFIHRYSGIFSAYGIGKADIIFHKQKTMNIIYDNKNTEFLENVFGEFIKDTLKEYSEQGYKQLEFTKYVKLRYYGTSQNFLIQEPKDKDYKKVFVDNHKRNFGFDFPNKKLEIIELRLKVLVRVDKYNRSKIGMSDAQPIPIDSVKTYFKEGWLKTDVFNLEALFANQEIKGPAFILDTNSTILIEPDCQAKITEYGDVSISVFGKPNSNKNQNSNEYNPITLSIFNNLFMSIANQMGSSLKNTSISTNIKERLDFSCALFDKGGNLVANAPHIPVHLGSLSYCIKQILSKFNGKIFENDVFITNDPQEGGSHLPDITVIAPKVIDGEIQYIVANRGHHADIGGKTPGSMPSFSHDISEEGALVSAFKIVENGDFQEGKIRHILEKYGARNIEDNISDIIAQISACQKGLYLLDELVEKYSKQTIESYMLYIQDVSEKAIRKMFMKFGKSHFHAIDFMDDGSKIELVIKIDKRNGDAIFDFSGSDYESYSNRNAPKSITFSAVVYVLRCLIDEELPLNEGFLRPIRFRFKENSILNPSKSAAVAGGNVTTSQRIVDVILKALGTSAASCGCMNNISFGNDKFGYYETLGGGAGATPSIEGADAIHTHMTNTRITDPEILERRYPVVVRETSVRLDSGGEGISKGGNGMVREIEFLENMDVNIITERRSTAPWGMAGGSDGKKGKNLLIKEDKIQNLGGKSQLRVNKNDRIRIETPGGGGYGNKK